jgi:sensor c-di-GMP phosphodiesterase-like protein
MARLVSVFISATHRRSIGVALWLLSFLAVLALIGWYAIHETSQVLQREARIAVDQTIRLRTNLMATFEAMHGELTASPCSAEFNEQLRRIAYRPDGLNEFLYAPGAIARCSVNVPGFAGGVALGEPDIDARRRGGVAVWVDHDLAFLGLEGEHGTIVLSEPFAAVVPPHNFHLSDPQWMSTEVVLLAPDGGWWHRGGEQGLYAGQVASAAMHRMAVLSGELHRLACDPKGFHCVASRADLAALLWERRMAVFGAVMLAAIAAGFLTNQANRLIGRYFAFDARFRRHLEADTIVCAYQPIMDLATGETTGCEVLARWRDIDDRIVYPDRFIDVVARHGMTLRFTELVARRAFEELSAHVAPGRRLQVNFNIFPCDLDSDSLARIFAPFTAQPDRFDLVLEIIESDEIPASAQREIERLRGLGIKTYIDDFGSGYSNMHNLAALSVDGVKLDRAFAMASDDSMMGQMLRHAVEMIQATGRVMVIEGVETAERLSLLRQMQARIDYVQGYFISRPLDIAGLASFLEPRPAPFAGATRAAGPGVVAA